MIKTTNERAINNLGIAICIDLLKVIPLAIICYGCGDNTTPSSINSPTTVIHDTVIVKIPSQDSVKPDSQKVDSTKLNPIIPSFTSVGDLSVVGSWLQYKYSLSAGSNVPSKMWNIHADGYYVKNSFTPCPGEKDLNSTCGIYEYGTVNFDAAKNEYTKIIDSTAKKEIKGGSIITTSRYRFSVTSTYRHIKVSWRTDGGLVLEGADADSVTNAYWFVIN